MMANQEHLDILKQGVEVWNRWRKEYPQIEPQLDQVNLEFMYLSRGDFHNTNFRRAYLYRANLDEANLYEANLQGTDLHSATLIRANLSQAALHRAYLHGTNLDEANLTRADLVLTDLSETSLNGTDFSQTMVWSTRFSDVNLSLAKGLNTVIHQGPSTIGLDTIYHSQGQIPEIFLQGAGVPNVFIDYIRFLGNHPIEYATCFISYSSKDENFVRQLYADLQAAGVRCWFAPEDMKIGDKIRPRINESIRMYDKLLLVLSEHSVSSKWVEFEVEAAMDKEQEGKPPVLFPVRLDNTVMESTTAWAAHIKSTRHIGDFTQWKNHDTYQKTFTRLLRDLKAEV